MESLDYYPEREGLGRYNEQPYASSSTKYFQLKLFSRAGRDSHAVPAQHFPLDNQVTCDPIGRPIGPSYTLV
jgi:hypothetical protein